MLPCLYGNLNSYPLGMFHFDITDELEFGTRQAPLVVRINKILADYPPGTQILKVSNYLATSVQTPYPRDS